MKIAQKVAAVLAIVVVAGFIVEFLRHRTDSKRMLKEIADEGYETANDVLFPAKNIGGRSLKYGPVLPI